MLSDCASDGAFKTDVEVLECHHVFCLLLLLPGCSNGGYGLNMFNLSHHFRDSN